MPPCLRVSVATLNGDCQTWQFTTPFRIGRVVECEVCVVEEHVSRAHAQVSFENGQWFVQDLQSANGLYAGEERFERMPVTGGLTFRLGVEGPFVSLEVEAVKAALPQPPILSEPLRSPAPTIDTYVERYFKERPGETVGDHTRMVRRAFHEVQSKQRSKYTAAMAILGVALLAAGGYAYYLRQEATKQKAAAQDIFYAIKSLDVEIAALNSADATKYQQRRKDLTNSYDRFLATLHVYDPKMSEEDKLILRVARIFGECEIAMPPEFASEVKVYIKKWQSSSRYKNDVKLAREKGYDVKISREMLANNLPPQFVYLALQESNFDALISGPMTRMGIAKGMWQFIPQTAVKYGLKLGPLVDLPRPDPGDDRHNYEKETGAAIRYIKELYATDAQASGLLVMACYNWGEDFVLPLVRSMPANPRDRNFWKLLATYRSRLPQETYDYVFYIVSAAVIGENPRLFGFDFDNPLANLEQK